MISIRILAASLIIQQFRWLWNSTRIRWPQNCHENFQWFQSEFWWPASLIIQQFRWLWNSTRIRWPQNWPENFQWFKSEFWLPASLINQQFRWLWNSRRIRWPKNWSEFWWPASLIIQQFRWLWKSFQELDDHGNNITIFNDFDQNSGCQPHYQTIQMAIDFFKN